MRKEPKKHVNRALSWGRKTYLYLLKMLILINREIIEREKAMRTSFCKPPQTVKNAKVVCALTRTGVVEWWYFGQSFTYPKITYGTRTILPRFGCLVLQDGNKEVFAGFLGCSIKEQHLPGTDQIYCISSLTWGRS